MSGSDPISGILGFVSNLIGQRGSSRVDTGTTQDQRVVSTGDTWSSGLQNMIEDSMLTTADTKTTSGTSKTKTNNVVSNTTDPGVVGFMKSLMDQSARNANDPTMTEGVVAGITNTLRDAMTTSFGKQQQAGLYGSSSTALINNDLISRASADAAQAVLGYRTGQQRLAFDTASDLGKMLSKQSTIGTQQTDMSQTVTDIANSFTTNRKALTTESNQRNQQTTQTKAYNTQGVSTRSSSGMISVVCTWMHKRGLLSTRKYVTTSADFLSKPLWQQKGYQVIGAPLVRYLEFSNGKGFLAFCILKLFCARTQQICAEQKSLKCKKTVWGWIARALIATVCFFPAIWYLFRETVSSIYSTSRNLAKGDF